MKKIIPLSFILIMLASLTLFGCMSDNNRVFAGSKDLKTEVRSFETFTGIGLSVAADLVLVQGSPQKVEIQGSADDLSKLVTEIRGKSLIFRKENGFSSMGRIKIYVTVENIESLSVSGSGNLTSTEPLKTSQLELHVSGSGNINLNSLTSQTIDSHVSGSGNINLSGSTAKVTEHTMHVSGSGDIYAETLETQKVDASISGSGTCKVFATESIEAHVSGSGDVYYKGNPRVNAKVSGSGKVRSL